MVIGGAVGEVIRGGEYDCDPRKPASNDPNNEDPLETFDYAPGMPVSVFRCAQMHELLHKKQIFESCKGMREAMVVCQTRYKNTPEVEKCQSCLNKWWKYFLEKNHDQFECQAYSISLGCLNHCSIPGTPLYHPACHANAELARKRMKEHCNKPPPPPDASGEKWEEAMSICVSVPNHPNNDPPQ